MVFKIVLATIFENHHRQQSSKTIIDNNCQQQSATIISTIISTIILTIVFKNIIYDTLGNSLQKPSSTNLENTLQKPSSTTIFENYLQRISKNNVNNKYHVNSALSSNLTPKNTIAMAPTTFVTDLIIDMITEYFHLSVPSSINRITHSESKISHTERNTM